jgi:isopentenyl diphosphate isomerase/L-lactate dehydrogenase-like FMN-dependent dehydrogenase
MSWQQVVIVIVFVLGGVVLGLHGNETLAATALGAAAGFLTQPLLRAKEPTRKDEVVSILKELRDGKDAS